jgi:isopentenyl diphosphate isomerase/L-lactate dehydrogenase-like FMN-dependent dehydrogenase
MSGDVRGPRPPGEPLSLGAMEGLARSRLPRQVYDYYAGGADDERTLRWNEAAYGRIPLRPRVLVDVSRVDASVELLGTRLSLPVILAPTAFQRLAHPEGERASARAARAAGTLLVASTLSTTPVEEIAAAAPGPFWFQLYVYRDRELSLELALRAKAAGARALCLTATLPVQGNRERDTANRFALPPGMEMANFDLRQLTRFPETAGSGLEAFVASQFDASLTWEAVEWLRAATGLPVLVKGVITPEDARIALEHGAAGIIVSNHGGRQLDTAEPTIVSLPRVVEAVAGRAPVIVDGGIRRGTDVVKALALGASAVGIGRPYLWALALGGEEGVCRALELLRHEVERALALTGRPSVRDLDPGLLGDPLSL